MIIVEGPDGAGKSTFIKRLRDQSIFVTVALGGPTALPEEMRQVLGLFRQLEKQACPIVWDRHPLISEKIYSELLDRPCLLPPEATLNPSVLIVYCRPPDPIIWENVQSGRHLKGVRERVGAMVDLYDEAMKNIDHLRYDYTDTTDSGLETIASCLERLNENR